MPMTTAPAARADRTRVALVEDDVRVRAYLVGLIDASDAVCLAWCVGSTEDAIARLADRSADVLLVDLGLPDHSGLEVIRACRHAQPDCAVMVITVFADEDSMVQAFEAGASGYLLKSGTEFDLVSHIRDLRAGGSPMSPLIARRLLQRWQACNHAPPVAPDDAAAEVPSLPSPQVLSPREFEVLDRVSRGFTYAEVGSQIGVATPTVQTHVRNIYRKLDVHNRSEAVFEARHLGLLR